MSLHHIQSRKPSSEDDNEVWEPVSNGVAKDTGDKIANLTQTFSMFHLLPKELRLLIWDYALTPRIISLYRRPDSVYQSTTQLAHLSQELTDPVVIWIGLACAESCRFVQAHYLEWSLWDFRHDILNTLYSPSHDVVYFPYEFHAPTLSDLPLKFPTQTHTLRTLALPSACRTLGVGSENDSIQVLEALHGFKGLRELVIVRTGAESDRQWKDGEKIWKLPDDVNKALTRLKEEKWPEWRVPMRFVQSIMLMIIDGLDVYSNISWGNCWTEKRTVPPFRSMSTS